MLPYIICFALTLAFAWTNEQLLNEKQHDKRLVAFTAVMVILIPAILAGCRDNIVGTDVYVYAYDVFEAVKQHGWEVVRNPARYRLDRIEIGFLLLAYLSSLLFSSVQGFLFVISLFVCAFTYLSLYKLRDSCSIFVGEWIFLFMCYNESYNAMRQYMAMAVILLAVAFTLKKQYLWTLPCIALAYSFHNSAVVALFIIAVTYAMTVETKYTMTLPFWKNTGLRLLGFIVICAFLSLHFQEVSTFLINLGVLSNKYLGYTKAGEHWLLNPREIAAYTSCYIFLILKSRKVKYAGAFLAFAVCDLSFYHLRTSLAWLYRISTYFLVLRVISLSHLRLDWKRILGEHKLSSEDMVTIGVLLSAVIFWAYFFIHKGDNETYPYLSTLLGIN